jgi:hypothetical protein
VGLFWVCCCGCCSRERLFCRVSIQREAADQFGFLGGVACRHLNSRTARYRMRVVDCRSGSNSQQRSDVKEGNRGCNKRSARTRGEILKSSETAATHQTHQFPVELKGASARRLSLRDPRRGDWIDTRNNFTRPTAAVPLVADFTTALSTGSARLGCVLLLGVRDGN